MPAHSGPDLESDRNVPKYDYISFMQGMIGDGKEKEGGPGHVRTGSHGQGVNGNVTPKTPTTPRR
jgi:hypothetical protein